VPGSGAARSQGPLGGFHTANDYSHRNGIEASTESEQVAPRNATNSQARDTLRGRRVAVLAATANLCFWVPVYGFTTCKLLVTEKIPDTLFARMPTRFLSPGLSTTPSSSTCPPLTIIRIGLRTPKA